MCGLCWGGKKRVSFQDFEPQTKDTVAWSPVQGTESAMKSLAANPG